MPVGYSMAEMDEPQTPLFRLEAILAANRAFTGERSRLVPVRLQMIVGVVTVLLGACAVAVMQVEITRRVVVAGALRPVDGQVEVRVPRAGVIDDLRVAEGQRVRRGQVLARIGSGAGWNEGGQVSQRTAASLIRRRSQLIAQREALARAGEATRRETVARLAQLATQLQQARRLVDVQQRRLHHARERFTRVGALEARGFLSAYAYGELRDGVLAREQAVVEGTLTRQRIEEQLHAQQEQARRRAEELTVELAEVDGRLAELELERTREQAIWSYELVAARDGTVSGLVDEQGDSVVPGQTLVTLLSVDVALEARVRVPARGAARLATGLPVALRIGAFPYQKFGTVPGTIRTISQTTVILDGRDAPAESAYLAEVELARQEIGVGGAARPLRAGMDVTAELITDRGTLWARAVDTLTALH